MLMKLTPGDPLKIVLIVVRVSQSPVQIVDAQFCRQTLTFIRRHLRAHNCLCPRTFTFLETFFLMSSNNFILN